MKNNKIKAVAVLALAGVMLAQPISTMAASFSDVRSDNWAFPHISKLADLRVISGYTDGTFKPKRSVSYLEIMQLLKGIQSPSAQDETRAISKFGQVSDKYKVPGWARSAICCALEKGVITEENLKAAFEKGYITNTPKAHQYPSRELIMVYYAKALGIEAKKNITNIAVKDINSIGNTPKALTGDVDIKGLYAGIIEAGVFHAKGDDGFFNPQQPLHRDQMATITNLSYDYKNKTKQTKDYEGEVYFNEEVNGTPTFALKGKDGKATAFVLGSDTKVTLNGKAGTAKDITVGAKVKVSAYASTTGIASLHAVKVDIVSNDVVGTGVVRSTVKDGITVDYVTKKDATVDSKFKADYTTTFKFDKDTKVKSLGKAIKADDIRSTDMVIFKARNSVLTEVEVYPQSGVASGEFVNFDYGSRFGGDATLYLKLADGKTYTFKVQDNRVRDDLYEKTKGLNKGYPLTIKTSYQNVVSATDTQEDLTGLFVDAWTYSYGESRIKIKTEKGEREFMLKDKITFKDPSSPNGRTLSVSDLISAMRSIGRPEYVEVKLHLTGGKVDGVTVVRRLIEKNVIYSIKTVTKIDDLEPGSRWAYNAWEGYSAYKIDYSGSSTHMNVKLPSRFQIKKEFDSALASYGNQGRLALCFDLYDEGGKYSLGNVRINGPYLKDTPIFPLNTMAWN